ncbi:hypothetical protein GCM10008020_41990 [Massilia psychrophila]|nr:hypothetical protein GCM10008020_41990 [Massilia psychrophila]
MSLDLVEMGNDEFDDWLRDQDGRAPGDDLTEEHLVQLVGTTLRGGDQKAGQKGPSTWRTYVMQWPTRLWAPKGLRPNAWRWW